MGTFQIRKLRDSDRVELLELAKAYWRFERISGFHAKKYWRLAKKISRNKVQGAIWVAVQGKRLVGYIVLCHQMSLEFGGLASEIDELYVVPDLRGRGVGKMLLQTSLNALKRSKCPKLSLRLGAKNSRGMRFYRKAGFQPQRDFIILEKLA